MHARSLQAIIGTALTDDGFRKALLNGSRRRVLQAFELSGEEIEAIMRLRGDSLEQFAGELHQLLVDSAGVRELNPVPILPARLARRRAGLENST